jgi:hypothetical protein
MVDKVAPYKYLSRGISFTPKVPRNAVGGLPWFYSSKMRLTKHRVVKSYAQSCESWLKRNLGGPRVITMEFAAPFQYYLHRFLTIDEIVLVLAALVVVSIIEIRLRPIASAISNNRILGLIGIIEY